MIEYIIENEDSSNHWRYFDVRGKNVLDLGCGRWNMPNKDEYSSVYFVNKGASKVIGVDSNNEEIDYFNSQILENSLFIEERINDEEKIKSLIVNHNITALKCDIEGDEIFLSKLTKKDLEHVKEIAIEFHSEELRDIFMLKLLEWGFEIKVKASFARTPSCLGVLFGYKPVLLGFNHKIAICYTCAGETYKSSALTKLNEYYFDHPNLYYYIITDDVKYFEKCSRINLKVSSLKEFQDKYPQFSQYEYFLESNNIGEYAEKYVNTDYKFPFSLFRYNILQAIEDGIYNISMLGTDSHLTAENITEDMFKDNTLYYLISRWEERKNDPRIEAVVDYFKEKIGYTPNKESIMVYDEACRLYILGSREKALKLFNLWDEVLYHLYETGKMQELYRGWYIMHDEWILAVIYDIMGIEGAGDGDSWRVMDVKHVPEQERFWMCRHGQ